MQIALEDLEKWYIESLGVRFKKEHKILTKIFAQTNKELLAAKNSLKSWPIDKETTHKGEKIDEKTLKIVERFVESVTESLNEVKIPTFDTEISYENSQNLIDAIKKVFFVYNSQGKKSMKRFGAIYTLELKEIDLHLRKIGDLRQKLTKFLIKHYQEAKTAETVLKRVPLFKNNIERLGTLKGKIGGSQKQFDEMKANLQNMEEKSLILSQDPDLQAFEKLDRKYSVKSDELRDSLKFKKALKKLRKSLEKGSLKVRDIREDDIKLYLKSSVSVILEEGPKIPRLRTILIKLRLMLEDPADPLKLKADLRNRIIANINKIVSQNSLEPLITKILSLRERKDEQQRVLVKKGLDSQRKELKEKIAQLTLDQDHFENDLSRRKREFKDLLAKVSEERNELQNRVKEETGEEIKLKIVIPTSL
jgi:hypothetical protein